MEPVFFDAKKDLLLCVYYYLHTKGVLYFTYEDVLNFEQQFTKDYNELYNTDLQFSFLKNNLANELKQNYELFEQSGTMKPNALVKKEFMQKFNALDNYKKHAVNIMITKTLSTYDMKQIIVVKKRKQMAIIELNSTNKLNEKGLEL